MTETPHVAIIILNWNNPDDTLACLRSVMALDYPVERRQVIVVDNGSTDDSVARIRAAYPGVTLIETGANLGYAGGNNVGIRQALTHGVEYIWLLNDDIIVASDSLANLVHVAVQTSKAAFLGPMVLIKEAPDYILSVGGAFVDGWQPVHLGIGEKNSRHYDAVMDVAHLSGCALLANTKALQAIGLLDEEFFAYHEDIEWCYRAQEAGWRVLSVPQARVWHPDTRHRDDASSVVTYYTTRNHLLFLKKHCLGRQPMLKSFIRYGVWIANWSVNPKWKHFAGKRDAVWWAVYDFVRGKTGRCEWPL